MKVAEDVSRGPGYTFAAAARELGCSRSWVSQLVRDRRLRCVTMHNRRYVSATSLAAYKANVTRREEARLIVPMFSRKEVGGGR